ncbi:MAG: ABC transporter ATP-binding protein [Angustibacter sp.]
MSGAGPAAHEVRQVVVRHAEGCALDKVDLDVRPGEHLVVVGANGSGKSTLLRVLAGLQAPTSGAVAADGIPLRRWSRRGLGRRRAVLTQQDHTASGLTVRELVALARYPHRGGLGMLRDRDQDVVDEALELLGMSAACDRALDSLSGGERQRARLAMTVAQRAPSLFLDEPTSFLDVRHQLEVLQLVEKLRRTPSGSGPRTVVSVLHDLGQALSVADRVAVLRAGRLLAVGTPEQVVESDVLSSALDVRVVSQRHEHGWICDYLLIDNHSRLR